MPASFALLLPLILAAPQDSDSLFRQALALPKERRSEARDLCQRALERSPNYHEIRVHLGRLLAWDGRYDEALAQLGQVLTREPRHLEARETAIDVARWADRPHEALRLAEAGLALDPRQPSLLLRRAKVLRDLDEVARALASVEACLQVQPDHPGARELREDLADLAQRSKVSLDHGRQVFPDSISPWETQSLTLAHRFRPLSLHGRLTRATRFDTVGTQLGLDAYPRLGEGRYAYVGLAWSDSGIFPRTSTGLEVFQSLPASFEGSLGLRRLAFSGAPVVLYTGSLGRYHGNSLTTLRVYVTPGKAGTSLSGSLSSRWYLEDADSYVSATVGTGLSMDEITQATETQVQALHASKASLGFQKKLKRSWILSAGVGWDRQEIRAQVHRSSRSLSLGLTRLF